MSRFVYLDNAATTSTKKEVVDAMYPFFTESFGNPSSVYDFAAKNKKAVNDSRQTIADALHADVRDIYFTGSESDNWALIATAEAYENKGKHIITSKIEHHAILHTCDYLESRGFEITYIDVDENGILKLDELKKAIKKETILISIMFANNEIGTIEPVEEVGKIAKENGILFHTDAVQAVGSVRIDVQAINIDMLSLSAHKFYGPKGIGALYVKQGIKFQKFMNGGHQERNKRAGTENVPAIVGLGEAIEKAYNELDEHTSKIKELRDYYVKEVERRIPYIKINGSMKKRLPGNSNISFRYIEGEGMLLNLDLKGISASSGSACTSGSLDPSHVLLAIGLPHEIAHGSLRITIGKYNTKEEVDYLLDNLEEIVARLRNMSPLYEDFLKSNK